MTEGPFQYFLAGARANVGMKSGRYMFEVKIIEYSTPADDQQYGRARSPTQFFKLGFSTAGSSPIPGEDEHSVCFDSQGNFSHNKTRTSACPNSQRLQRDSVVAVLLNLDDKSPNANT